MAANLIKTRAAYWEENAEIGKIAKASPYTSGFHGTVRGEALARAYQDKLIGVTTDLSGFVYCCHLKVKPSTTLHYLGVRPQARGRGAGRALVAWVLSTSPHDQITLKAETRNLAACGFYEKIGFVAAGHSLTKKQVRMTLYTASREDLTARLAV